MIHFITVHFHSERWIDVQLHNIARHTDADYLIWACLNGIDPSYNSRFHEVFDLEGEHPEKLNAIAERVLDVAAPDDLLVFIDGDAFPIDAWIGPITTLLARHKVVAVQRNENLGDPQPHPCFAVTTAGFWKEIGGDWSRGGQGWINAVGRKRQDAGGKVMERLDELGLSWHPLLRSNKVNLHPVLFAVYGDLVYHHGAAFRQARTTVDLYLAGEYRWTAENVPRLLLIALGPILRGIVRFRLARREKRNLRISERIIEGIEHDDEFVKRTFLKLPMHPKMENR